MAMIFEIGDKYLPALQKRVDRAAKRAPKVGLPAPTLTILSQQFRSFEVKDRYAEARADRASKRKLFAPTVTVSLDGFLPKVGDWSFLGYRYFDNRELKTIGSDVPDAMKARGDLCCEHCQTKRNRYSTSVLKNNNTSQIFEIGNNCASAFIGYDQGFGLTAGTRPNFNTQFKNTLDEAGKIIEEFQQTAEIDLSLDPTNTREDIVSVLAVAHRIVCEQGFLSAADAGQDGWPTWRQVEHELALSRTSDGDDGKIEVNAFDFLTAEDIIASYQDPYPSNFNLAVKQTIENGAADRKDIAILTAAVNSYITRQQKVEANREVAQLAEQSVYVKEPGKRFNFIGKVHKVTHYDGDFGPISFITMFDADMNLMHWKASGSSLLKEGEAYEMKGTVKEHRECKKGPFAGYPETVVTRVKVNASLGPTAFEKPHSTPDLNREDEEALDDFLSVMSL